MESDLQSAILAILIIIVGYAFVALIFKLADKNMQNGGKRNNKIKYLK